MARRSAAVVIVAVTCLAALVDGTPGRRQVGVVSGSAGVVHVESAPLCSPQGGLQCAVDLTDISLWSSTEGWVVGEGGYIARFSSGRLEPVQSPTTERIEAVAAVSADEAWAVGGGIFHYADGAWSVAMPSDGVAGRLLDVDFYSAEAGWAVGEDQRMLRFDAGAWAPEAVPESFWAGESEAIVAIDAPAVDVAWALADDGSVFQFANGEWTRDDIAGWSPFNHPRDIAMISPTEGWVVGAMHETRPLLYRRKASGWWDDMRETEDFPLLADHSGIVALAAAEDVVWAATAAGGLMRFADGVWTWSNLPLGPVPTALTMTNAVEGWAVGALGTVLRLEAGCWQRAGGPRVAPGPELGTVSLLIWRAFLPTVVGAVGSTPLERLTSSPLDEWQPALSSDGLTVAYVVASDEQYSTLHFRDACGNAHAAWPEDPWSLPDQGPSILRHESPSYFPDGRMLVHGSILREDGADRSRFVEIVPDGRWLDPTIVGSPSDVYWPRRPSVALGGDRVAYDADAGQPPGPNFDSDINREIYLYDRASFKHMRITDHPAADTQASLSPDGKSVFFVSDRDGNSEIYRSNVDGSGLTRLTEHPAQDTWPSPSRDGRTLIFQSDRTPGDGIFALNMDTGGVVRLTDPSYRAVTPRVAPDGRSVVFAADVHGQFDIFRLPLPATELAGAATRFARASYR